MNMQHHKAKVCFRGNRRFDIKTLPVLCHISSMTQGRVALAGTVPVRLLSYLSDKTEGGGSRGMKRAKKEYTWSLLWVKQIRAVLTWLSK